MDEEKRETEQGKIRESFYDHLEKEDAEEKDPSFTTEQPDVVMTPKQEIAQAKPVVDKVLLMSAIAKASGPEKPKAFVGISNEVKPLIPSDLDGAWRMCIAFAKSKLLPKSYGNGTEDEMAAKAFLAMQLGAEVGLTPMAAIQSIAVVNGQPSIWGDAQLALVRRSGLLKNFKEEVTGSMKEKNLSATCSATRSDTGETISNTFDYEDATVARLITKDGTWQTHPKRMMRYKARAFTLRDLFSDVLKGLTHSVEEMQGEMLDVTPPKSTLADELNNKYLGADNGNA